MFGVDPVLLMCAVYAVGVLQGIAFQKTHTNAIIQRLRMKLRNVVLEAKSKQPRLHGECTRCMAELPQGHRAPSISEWHQNQSALALAPTPAKIAETAESVRKILEENAPVASTGCVLTDQIFEAARAKGIMPIDFLGPAPEYDSPDAAPVSTIEIFSMEPVEKPVEKPAIPKWENVDWDNELPRLVQAKAPDDIKWMFPRPNGPDCNWDWLNDKTSQEDAIKYAQEKWGYSAMYQRMAGNVFALAWTPVQESAIPKWEDVDWNGELPFRVRVEVPRDILWMFPCSNRSHRYDWLNKEQNRGDADQYAINRRHSAMYLREGGCSGDCGDTFILVWIAPKQERPAALAE